MADQNVSIGFDVQQVIAGSTKFVEKFNLNEEALKNFTIEAARFSSTGKLLGVTIKGMLNDQDQLFARVKKTKEEFKVTSGFIEKNTKVLRENAAAAKKAAEEQRKLAADVGANSALRNAFVAPSNANLSQIRAYEAAIRSVSRAVQQGKITQEQLNAAIARSKTGNFTNLSNSSEEGKLLVNLRALSNIFKSVTKDVDDANKAGKAFGLTYRDAFRIAEATLFKSAVAAITTQVLEGIRTAREYQIIISQIRTISQDNQLSFGKWSEEIRKVSDSFGIDQIEVAQAAYDAISNQVVKSTETFKFLATAAELARVSQSKLTDTQNILSSVINSYNLKAEDAERVSAQLFKTVDLGRVKLSELSNSIGRTTFLGNALGVTMEEVQAAVATLTIQGVGADTAQTFLINVFQKLLKPTEELKRVLEGYGVATGTAAVKTFGFINVLQKLNDEARKGNADLGAIFNEIRGRSGAEGLANVAGLFEENLGKITGALDNYTKAKEIRAESPADFLDKEFNKVKNLFINDIGGDINAGLVSFIKTIKLLNLDLRDVISGVGQVGKAFLIYKAALATTRLAGAAFTAITVGQTTSLAAFTAATTGATVATVSFNKALLLSGIGGLALGIGAAIAEMAIFGRQVEELTERSKQIAERGKRNKGVDDPTSAVSKNSAKQFDALKTAADKTFQSIFQGVARVSSSVNLNLDQTRGKIKGVTDALDLNFKTYENSLRDGINSLSKGITDTENQLKQSQRFLIDFSEQNKDSVFQFQIEFATPQQQVELVRSKIEELKKEAASLFDPRQQSGESIDDFLVRRNASADQARQKLKQASDLILENERRLIEIEKQRKQQAGEFGIIEVSSVSLKQQLLDITNRLAAGEAQYGKNLQTNLSRLQQLKIEDQKRVDTLNKAFDNFQKISVTDKEGNVNNQFKTNGQIDINKLTAEIENQLSTLRQAAGTDAAAQVQLFALGEQKKTLLLQEAEKIRTQSVIRQQQERIQNEKKLFERQIQEAQDRTKATSSGVFGEQGTIKNIRQNLIDIEKTVKGTVLTSGPLATGPIEKLRKLLDEIEQKSPQVNGLPIPKVEDVLKLQQAAQAVREGVGEAFRRNETKNFDKLSFPGSGVNLGQLLKDLGESVNKTSRSPIEASVAQATLDQINEALKKLQSNPTLDQLKSKFPEVQQAGAAANTSLQESFGGTLNSIQKVSEAVDALDRKLRALPLKGIDPNGNVAEDALGFARGGIVPGSPRGTDTVPAWLTPGERVLTVAQNRQITPFLHAMGMIKPRYYSQGGNVTNINVGDINNNMASNNSQQNVDQFAKALRRSIKQGRNRLD